MAKRRRRDDDKKIHKKERQSHRDRRQHSGYDDDDGYSSFERRSPRRDSTKRRDLMVVLGSIIIIVMLSGGYIFYTNYYDTYFNSGDDNGNNNKIVPNPSNNGNNNDYYDVPNFDLSDPLNPVVIIEVEDYGPIVCELYRNRNVVLTVDNFLDYVNRNFYNGLIFHRVIDDFMIQGGGYDQDMIEKSIPPDKHEIPLEIDPTLRHVDGALAMARKGYGGENDPEGKNTATCQFYICDGTQSFLNDNYAVFGQVVAGLDIVHQISSVSTNENDQPITNVIIRRVYQYHGT
jgi:cyclophilin family peptidyl-prolyl cis-trans isomerase